MRLSSTVALQSNHMSAKTFLMVNWFHLMYSMTCDKKAPLLTSCTIWYVAWAMSPAYRISVGMSFLLIIHQYGWKVSQERSIDAKFSNAKNMLLILKVKFGLQIQFTSKCQSVLGQDFEPQIAPDGWPVHHTRHSLLPSMCECVLKWVTEQQKPCKTL